MIQQWNTERVLDEYRAYASPKIRDGDVEYISKFQLSDIAYMRFAPLAEDLPLPLAAHPQPLERAHRGRLVMVALVAMLLWLSLQGLISGNRTNSPQSL